MRLNQTRKIIAAIVCCVIMLVCIEQYWMPTLTNIIDEEEPNGRIDTRASAPNPYENGKYLSPALEQELNFLKRNDIEFTEKMEHVARMRRSRLEDACAKANLSQPLPVDFSISSLPYQPVLLVSDEYKAMFCFTGDVYSEIWRDIFGLRDLRVIQSYRPESIAYRMKYYFKFLLAQDPLLRLMGAYDFGLSSSDNHVINEKGEDISNELMALSQKIRSDYQDHGNNGESRERQDYALFQDFAAYIVQRISIHEAQPYLWERIHVMCSPCSIKYDYISLAESVSNDVRYLTSQLSISSSHENDIHTDMDSSNLTSSILTFIKKFGFELLKKVIKVYQNDYDLFGYTPIKV